MIEFAASVAEVAVVAAVVSADAELAPLVAEVP